MSLLPRAPTAPRRLARASRAFLLALVLAPPLMAQEAAPEFLIERITVEGLHRASPQIIISESLLEAGRSYTEREISLGVNRVEHLPFVLAVDVSLRRGSERGKYELVLTVKEARRFFFGTDLLATRLSRSLTSESAFIFDETLTSTTTVGIRQFLGAYGLAFAAVNQTEGVQVGFSHYRLLNRPIFGSVAFSKTECCTSSIFPLGLDPSFSSWSNLESRTAAFTFGVPLRRDRSLRLHLSLSQADGGGRTEVLGPGFFDDFFEHDSLQEARLEALWLNDTTDDALFPTEGRLITAGLDHRTVEAEQRVVTFDVGVRELPLPAYDAHLLRVVATGAWYWTPGELQTFGASTRIAIGRSSIENFPLGGEDVADLDFQTLEASVGLRHSLSLLGHKRTRRFGDLRWETTLDYGFEATADKGIDLEGSLGQLRVGTSLVYRSTWGVFRFGFVYLDVRRL